MTAPVILVESVHGWHAMMGDHCVGSIARRDFDPRKPACWVITLPLSRYGTRQLQPEFARSMALAKRQLLDRIADWFEAAGVDVIAREIRASPIEVGQ